MIFKETQAPQNKNLVDLKPAKRPSLALLCPQPL